MYYIGLDAGTSNMKAVAFDDKGNIISCHSKANTVIRSENGHVEIDATKFWLAAEEVLRGVVLDCGKENIKTIAISALGEAFLAVDHDGNPLTHIITNTDVRGVKEVQAIEKAVSATYIMKTTGLTPSSTYSLPKICNVMKSLDDNKVWKYLLAADYLIYKLTGKAVTDYSMASRTMAFDIHQKKWDKKMLEAVGLPVSKFADVVCAGTAIGSVDDAVIASVGFHANTLVIAGGHDQPCGALGAGCISPGDMANSCGTTECITPVLTGVEMLEGINAYKMPCEPSVIDNGFITMAYNLTAGNLLAWFVEEIYYHGEPGDIDGALKKLEKKAETIATDVMVLPHFSGAATPHMDERSKGAFVKLTLNTKVEEMYLAIVESLVFEMKLNMENIEASGLEGNHLNVFGGGAKSALWLKLKASILNKELRILRGKEAGALGAAILGTVACGTYKAIEEAVDHMVGYEKVIRPNPAIRKKYQEKYDLYKSLYEELKAINHRQLRLCHI